MLLCLAPAKEAGLRDQGCLALRVQVPKPSCSDRRCTLSGAAVCSTVLPRSLMLHSTSTSLRFPPHVSHRANEHLFAMTRTLTP